MFKKALLRTTKIVLIIIAVIALLFFGLWCVDRIAFSDFYANASAMFATPGVNEGYVQQGFDYDETEKIFLSAGYMNNETASRVYVTDENGNSYHTELKKKNGKDYTGHTGGIVHNGEYVYITGSSGVDVFSYTDILNKTTSSTKCLGTVSSYIDPAYCYIYNGYLFTGSFYDGGKYLTSEYQYLTTPAGDKNHSMMTVFKLSATETWGISPEPVAVISTPDKAQGVCFTDDNKLVVSTSYGLSASQLYVYDLSDLATTDSHTFETSSKTFSVPVYYLENNDLVKTITAPPMSEELVYLNGKIYIITESASNKYFFGKFTSGLSVYAYNYK